MAEYTAFWNCSIHRSRRLSFGPRFSPSGRKNWASRFWILFHVWMNCGTSRMESSKAHRARDSRLRQVTTRDRNVRRPQGKEEHSLGRGTTGEPWHWGALSSQVAWLGWGSCQLLTFAGGTIYCMDLWGIRYYTWSWPRMGGSGRAKRRATAT